MPQTQLSPIGIPGQPWGAAEKSAWLAQRTRQRSYADDVLSAIDTLRAGFEVVEYGRLDFDPARYPLFALKARKWDAALPVALVTGGVHGYETSGVHGALAFAKHHTAAYQDRINLLIAPCVSPWAYETIQRWNPHAVDPNRSFGNRAAQESAALLDLVMRAAPHYALHVDLHETTDTDESEFRPALAARDGKLHEPGEIPDGFYLVDDTDQHSVEFQTAIIEAVRQVTHIAPADARGEIIGSPVVAPGVIRYPLKSLGLCAGLTDAPYRTTTEVYPDSPRTNPQECIEAQVAAVRAALDFVLAPSRSR